MFYQNPILSQCSHTTWVLKTYFFQLHMFLLLICSFGIFVSLYLYDNTLLLNNTYLVAYNHLSIRFVSSCCRIGTRGDRCWWRKHQIPPLPLRQLQSAPWSFGRSGPLLFSARLPRSAPLIMKEISLGIRDCWLRHLGRRLVVVLLFPASTKF